MKAFVYIAVSFRMVLVGRLFLINLAAIIPVWYGSIFAFLTGLSGTGLFASRTLLTISVGLEYLGNAPQRAIQLATSVLVSAGFSGMVCGVVKT